MGILLKTKPKILLATTCRWLSSARLAMALAECGCEVEVLCPANHPFSKIQAVARTYSYSGLRPVRSFSAAIQASAPDFIVPCDELTVHTLQRLALSGLLSDSSKVGLLSRRADSLALAREEGVCVPETGAVRSIEELLEWLNGHGYPAVLKADNTSGGRGVRVIHTPEQAHKAFRALGAPPLAARAAKRAIVDRDLTLILPWLRCERPLLSVQRFVAGLEATSTFACWEGEVLASLAFDVILTWKAGGPASVLQVSEDPTMRETAEKLARRLNLSGIYGLDFILEEGTGAAYLIEINARATQTCHLAFGLGRDLPAALAAAVAGRPASERPCVTSNQQVALFPLEWQRNPASRYLKSAYHDVPWEEPKLVQLSLREPGWAWLARYEAWTEFWAKRRRPGVPAETAGD